MQTTEKGTIYQQVKTLAGSIVKHYRDDLLKHDRASLAKHDGTPFLHFSRECGTHLIHLLPAEDYPAHGVYVKYVFASADREHILQDTRRSVVSIVNSEVTELMLHYDGQRLREVTAQKAIDIANEYVQRIRKEWRKCNAMRT